MKTLYAVFMKRLLLQQSLFVVYFQKNFSDLYNQSIYFDYEHELVIEQIYFIFYHLINQ